MISFGTEDGLSWYQDLASSLMKWLAQPHIMAIVIAWAVTFTIVCSLILALGFGPVGIGAGTLATVFQSYMYGAFTPAGGIFATLTSMAMLGSLMPAAAIFAAFLASGVAIIFWACDVGR
ncbi:hypothetical protein PWT90_03393 [Aphanocladium album]|nr:hypothetical protein PWT90_03393 [Aphanocladium album]